MEPSRESFQLPRLSPMQGSDEPANRRLRPHQVRQRFDAKVSRCGDHECWPWKGSVTRGGYGQMWLTGHGPTSAHRLAWLFANGPIPSGQSVLHRCDNPPCCNPVHLFLGTHADNMRDAVKKRRFSVARPNRQKLSSETLAAIDALLANGHAQIAIARRFGVSKGWIGLYAKGHRRQYDRPGLKVEATHG